MSRFDAIVIGSGHNGLIAANYLADAGKRVLVLERRGLVGGATVTEEFHPGFRASSCAYVSGLLHPVILKDLGLSAFGLELYQTDMGSANILRDGRHLFLYNELGRTLRELERASPGDADALAVFGLRLERFASVMDRWLLVDEPPSLDEVVRTFDAFGAMDMFTEFFTLSGLDLIDRYFTGDIVRGLLMFLAMVSVHGGPRTPGWSYVYGHHAIGEFNGRMGQFAFPRGGMGSIAESLAARARARGAVVRTEAEVLGVDVVRGAVTGVHLADGASFEAPAVLSNADPARTLLRMVDPELLPDGYASALNRYDDRGSMARVLLALDRLPDFVGCDPGAGPQHRGLTLLGAEVEAFERVADAQRYGRIPDDFPIELIVQTAHDDSLAPPGQHVLSTGVQQLPFELAGTDWDRAKDAFTARVLDVLETYSPGIKDSVLAVHTITPLDLDREYGLPSGNIFHGAMTLGQLFDNRPVPGYGSYRTPVPGLYLCGAGTHPGGGVMGAPGRNAAHALLKDEAAGGWTRARPVRGATPPPAIIRPPLVHRLMERPGLRRAALKLAQVPVIGRAADALSKR
jgi:phytoene dehydrogenase-like protein